LAFIVMVEAAHLRDFDHPSLSWQLSPAELWGVFAERKMGAPLMVIAEIRGERAAERPFPKHDDMVQALAPDRANYALDLGTLPRRSRCGKYLLDAHGLHLLDEVLPEDSVAVAQ
jgi:hypothetical protein